MWHYPISWATAPSHQNLSSVRLVAKLNCFTKDSALAHLLYKTTIRQINKNAYQHCVALYLFYDLYIGMIAG